MSVTTDTIKSFIKYGDYSLAVRRMLDASFETSDKILLQDTIKWSRSFSTYMQKDKSILPESFFSEADKLLDRLALKDDMPLKTLLLLKADNIEKKYKKASFTLSPISLEIKSGDVLGVVGENGNGKTTLLSCLAGQLAIDNGAIEYMQLHKIDYYNIKHHVAFIPQRIPEWYGLLKDNLHFSASLAGITGEENSLMVDFVLERLKLSSYAHLTWKQISSGYRTRFEIARVLLQKPSLLILDEPLSNLDIKAQQTLLTDLRYLAKSSLHPTGIILSSQQLHEVEKVADTVFLIKQGNCIHKTNNGMHENAGHVIEVESITERDIICNIMGADVEVHYNGGFFTLTSAQYTPKEMLERLVSGNVDIRYFRDITHSTKRYF